MVFPVFLWIAVCFTAETVLGTDTKKECKALTVEKGHIKINHNSRKIICDYGYRRLGEDRIFCQPNGTWSSNPPYCQGGDTLKCLPQLSIPCQTAPIGFDYLQRCQIYNGSQWEITCPRILTLLNGTISPNPPKAKIGATANISCDDYHLLMGPERMTCTINGIWEPNRMVHCHKVRCPDILGITNGSVEPSTPPMPGHVDISCVKGFKLVGPSRLDCTEDGKWSPNVMPYCSEITCPRIFTLPNGTISPNPPKAKIGATAKISCDDYHLLMGTERMTCTETGNWEPHRMVYCYEVRCPDFLGITNGSVEPSTPSRPGHVDISCEEGFKLVGPSRLNCTEDGKWSPNVMPSCRVECKADNNVIAISASVSGAIFGIAVFVILCLCKKGCIICTRGQKSILTSKNDNDNDNPGEMMTMVYHG